jgi:hypothetical protein
VVPTRPQVGTEQTAHEAYHTPLDPGGFKNAWRSTFTANKLTGGSVPGSGGTVLG